MSKRPAQDDEQTSPQALKAGERPIANSAIPDGENFEDEFEDEFESEDEILEAGVDGRHRHRRALLADRGHAERDDRPQARHRRRPELIAPALLALLLRECQRAVY